MRHNRGFSLIELMIVVTIISITFGVIITTYSAAQRSSRDSKRQADLRTIQGGLQQYYADQNYFPLSVNMSQPLSFGSGATQKVYLNNMPQDPTAGNTYCYIPAASQADLVSVCSSNCQSYTLYAQLENPPSGSTTYSCGGANTYNFKLTPP